MAGRAVLPREAIAFLRAKRLKPSRHWLSVWREEHAAAFTVAQMTEQDLLRQVHREVQRVLRRGETVESFLERLEPWLEAKGWAPTGRGGDLPARLRRIYHTNLRTAHLRGQWDRIQRTKEALPWLVYGLGPSEVHREQHAAWAGLCLRVDDPFWGTHYPPNGWGCKCWVRQVAEPPEGAVTEAPRIETRPWTNPATGESVRVPVGIDPGWDYNPAEHAGLGTVEALTDRLQRLSKPPAEAPLPTSGAAAREAVREAAAPARRRLDEQQGRLDRLDAAINDPERAITSAQLAEREVARRAVDDAAEEMAARARGVFLRRRAASFRNDAEPRLPADAPPGIADGIDQWRRMVAPDLVRQVRPPKIELFDSEAANGTASYWNGRVQIARTPAGKSHQRVLAHELSHLLEADENTFRSAVGFLARRAPGERPAHVTVHASDYRAMRDEWVDFDEINESRGRWRGGPGGRPAPADLYPGRVYPTAEGANVADWGWGAHEAALPTADGDVMVYATEVLSRGVEWMWANPLAFAEADPEYFDFIWRVVVLGR